MGSTSVRSLATCIAGRADSLGTDWEFPNGVGM